MREVRDSTINGVTYKVQQLGAKQGRAVLARCLKIVGPAIQAEDTLGALSGTINDADLEFLCDVFSKTSRVVMSSGAEIILADCFDEHFAGKYAAMLKWLWFCLEVNYSDFLGEIGLTGEALQSLGQAMMPTMQTMQTAPIGASGALSQKVGGAS